MMLSCEQAEARLTPWVDGEMAAADRVAMAAHLAACSGCAERAARERTARALVQQRRSALLAETAPDLAAAANSMRRCEPIGPAAWISASTAPP